MPEFQNLDAKHLVEAPRRKTALLFLLEHMYKVLSDAINTPHRIYQSRPATDIAVKTLTASGGSSVHESLSLLLLTLVL